MSRLTLLALNVPERSSRKSLNKTESHESADASNSERVREIIRKKSRQDVGVTEDGDSKRRVGHVTSVSEVTDASP